MADEHGNITTADAAELNADAHKYAASKGWAMEDGSYPIRPLDNHGESDLKKAIQAVGRGGSSHNAIRKHIIARAKALGLSDTIPENWNSDGSQSESDSYDPPPERRFTPGLVEIRSTGEDSRRIGGYGAVFGKRSRDLGGFVETVDSVAFRRSAEGGWSNVVARYNHSSDFILGSTSGGNLDLRTDENGLLYEVELPQTRSDVLELIQRGDIAHSSFAFRTLSDEWRTTEDNYPHRVLSDVELIDVAPVAHPAYPDATAGLRSLAAQVEAPLEEVRAYAESGELHRLLTRTDRPTTVFGPSAAVQLRDHRGISRLGGAAASYHERKETAMSELAQRLQEQRSRVHEDMKTLADAAAGESRNFTDEEQTSWDGQASTVDALDARIAEELDREERSRKASEVFERLEEKPVSEPARTRERDPNAELRAFFRGEGPRAYEVRPSQTQIGQKRSLNTGTGSEGGDLVPRSFYDRLVQHMIENASIMQAGVTVINTNGGEPMDVPKTTQHPTAEIVSEGSSIGEHDPAFGSVTLGAYKYGTLVKISREMLSDEGVDLEGYVAAATGRALGNAFGAHAITGTGSSQPKGVLPDATSGITGDVTTDNLIDLYYAVIAPYRASQSCRWLMNDSTVAAVRKLQDGSGQYIFQQSLVQSTPDTLLGKPLLTDPSVPAPAASKQSIVFGDFAAYFVRLAGGVRFERSDDFAFDSDMVTFRALMRADGSMVDLTGALKTLTGAAA